MKYWMYPVLLVMLCACHDKEEQLKGRLDSLKKTMDSLNIERMSEDQKLIQYRRQMPTEKIDPSDSVYKKLERNVQQVDMQIDSCKTRIGEIISQLEAEEEKEKK